MHRRMLAVTGSPSDETAEWRDTAKLSAAAIDVPDAFARLRRRASDWLNEPQDTSSRAGRMTGAESDHDAALRELAALTEVISARPRVLYDRQVRAHAHPSDDALPECGSGSEQPTTDDGDTMRFVRRAYRMV